MVEHETSILRLARARRAGFAERFVGVTLNVLFHITISGRVQD
jgi:hypothetical protein